MQAMQVKNASEANIESWQRMHGMRVKNASKASEACKLRIQEVKEIRKAGKECTVFE